MWKQHHLILDNCNILVWNLIEDVDLLGTINRKMTLNCTSCSIIKIINHDCIISSEVVHKGKLQDIYIACDERYGWLWYIYCVSLKDVWYGWLMSVVQHYHYKTCYTRGMFGCDIYIALSTYPQDVWLVVRYNMVLH